MGAQLRQVEDWRIWRTWNRESTVALLAFDKYAECREAFTSQGREIERRATSAWTD
jgi:hypothetical protein